MKCGLVFLGLAIGILWGVSEYGVPSFHEPETQTFANRSQSASELAVNLGILRSKSPLLGTGISHVYVENALNVDRTNVRVQLVFLKANGSTQVKHYYVGSLPAGSRWEKSFSWHIRNADCVDFTIVSDQGIKSTTLDIANGNWELIEN